MSLIASIQIKVVIPLDSSIIIRKRDDIEYQLHFFKYYKGNSKFYEILKLAYENNATLKSVLTYRGLIEFYFEFKNSSLAINFVEYIERL